MASFLESIPLPLRERVMEVGAVAAGMGWNAYLVGGAVRDLLLGRPSLDVDIAIEGDAAAVALALTSGGRVVVHHRFGTATLRGSGWRVDLAMTRRESYPHPGALPTVAPGTIQEDLFRRDFTINAMALALSPPSVGELLDPLRGQEDLSGRLIRVLHPRSFVEDATRILRALRYEQRFGFRLEAETERLVLVHADMLDTISADRLRRELELMLREDCPERGIARAGKLGVLERLGLPPARWGEMVPSFEKAREGGNSTPLLYLCLLAYPLQEEELEAFLKRLRFPPTTAHALRDTLHLKAALPTLPTSPGQAVAFLEGYSPTAIAAVALGAPQARETLERFLGEWRHAKAPIGGKELIALGVPPGPQVGLMLRRLQLARLDGLITSREQAEALVRRWLRP